MLSRLGFPTVGPHRRFVTAMTVDAVGSGVFMPVSILYFLATTDLSLLQVGTAISLASLVALPVGPLLGGLVDAYGAKRVLLAGNLLEAGGFLAYLVSDSLVAVVVWTVVVTVGRSAFWGSYGAIVVAISRPGERELWFGFLGALRNLGFAVGGLLSGVAVTIGTVTAYEAVVVLNALSYLLAFGLLLGVPALAPGRDGVTPTEPGGWGTVLRDRPYLLLVGCQLAYSMAMMVLNVAIPVYVVATLELPGWVMGVLFTLNCLIVGFGQGLAVRAMTGRVRWRMLLLADLVFAVSFLALLGAGRLPAAFAVATVLVSSAVYTIGEITGGPVLSALAAEAASDHLRGRYLALIQLTWNVANTVAPLTFAWLLELGPGVLWPVLTVMSLLGGLVAAALGRRMPLARARITNQAEDAALA